MKKTSISMAVLALLLSVVQITAATAEESGPTFSPGGDEVQVIAGTIALPTRFTDTSGGFPGLGRRLFNCSQNSNGVISYIAPIDKAAWGGPFEITDVTAGATTPDIPEADIDVFIYEELADCEYPGAAPVTLSEHDGAGPGETGFIPEGARFAVIYTPTAIDASFNMRLYAPPVINIGDGSFDLTVASGATVEFLNDTGDYAFVRDADGSFDSSPGPATGIRSGDAFRHTFSGFFGSTTYTIQTSQGTGTITVNG